MQTENGAPVGLSRRNVLSLAPVATVATAAGVTGGLIPRGLSPELATLEREFDAARAAYLALATKHDEAERRWYALRPKQPDELKWPFGLTVDPTTNHTVWTAAGLRKAAEGWRASTERFAVRNSPDAVASFARDIARAEELIPVAEVYEAAQDHALRVSNLRALERESEAALDAVDRVTRRLMAAPVSSPADFAVKVRVLREWAWKDLQDHSLEEDDVNFASAARIVADALALIDGAPAPA